MTITAEGTCHATAASILVLQGEKRAGDKRGAGAPSAGAVIEGKAKKYKTDDGPQYTAAQIAMMGGDVKEKAKQPTGAMPVGEFLNKGGAAALPRKAQDRKDKEKRKRELGQSAIGTWKTEAEMALRQQYDS